MKSIAGHQQLLINQPILVLLTINNQQLPLFLTIINQQLLMLLKISVQSFAVKSEKKYLWLSVGELNKTAVQLLLLLLKTFCAISIATVEIVSMKPLRCCNVPLLDNIKKVSIQQLLLLLKTFVTITTARKFYISESLWQIAESFDRLGHVSWCNYIKGKVKDQ